MVKGWEEMKESEDMKEAKSSLKELTWENHHKAERKGFAKKLLRGKI